MGRRCGERMDEEGMFDTMLIILGLMLALCVLNVAIDAWFWLKERVREQRQRPSITEKLPSLQR